MLEPFPNWDGLHPVVAIRRLRWNEAMRKATISRLEKMMELEMTVYEKLAVGYKELSPAGSVIKGNTDTF